MDSPFWFVNEKAHAPVEMHGLWKWQICHWLGDGLSFRGQRLQVRPDEFLNVGFDFDEELATDPRELMSALFGRRQSEFLHMFSANQFRAHTAVPSVLNFN
jgi:hypothetical protein